MIDTVVVAREPEVQAGIRRLLESDGDIRAVETRASLDEPVVPPGSLIVVGPGVAPTSPVWEKDDHRVVVLVPVPGWDRLPASVVQVPMELSGRALREAVRRAARRRRPLARM